MRRCTAIVTVVHSDYSARRGAAGRGAACRDAAWLGRLLVAALAFSVASACYYPPATPEQNALTLVRVADSVYLETRQWANTEHSAGRLSDARFQEIASVAERLRAARSVAVAVLSAYLDGSSTLQTLEDAMGALAASVQELKAARHG